MSFDLDGQRFRWMIDNNATWESDHDSPWASGNLVWWERKWPPLATDPNGRSFIQHYEHRDVSLRTAIDVQIEREKKEREQNDANFVQKM